MSTTEALKQQNEFKAWGMPLIYLATAAMVFAAFVPHFRANADYLKLHIAGYVGKLSIFAAINIVCSIFMFWSPAIHYALINFLLNFMILCTISIPAFPKTFAKNFAFIFFIWMLIYTGVAPVLGAFGSDEGVLNKVSSGCTSYYNYPSVSDKICVDGWVTFTLFCAIITIGLTFLANLLLISVAFDPTLQGEEQSSLNNDSNGNGNVADQYQQPTINNATEGGYQSYQNAENNA